MIQLPEIGPLLSDRPLTALPLAFLGGVLTSLTPCIYPMIPITASLVGGQTVGTDGRNKRRAVALTFAYVLGLALFYAILGLIAGMTGTMFGSVSTNPWLHLAIANLLILAALAMLDVIPIRLPAALAARAASAGEGGRIAGAFVMGAASGLVAAPCGAPVMVTVLTWVSLTKSAALGFLYLFVFSLGMCTLLIAVGISVGVLGVLPRAGGWMIWVKRIFALIMLIMAEYYLVRMGGLLI
ncbi:MAG TPA: cytochrome c biogenesis protein CcdA [Gemmatimonadaceae bacterium]|nr:cytochrome c biogenesis protein CcdA [Gemmatimonadaceae bacterium]